LAASLHVMHACTHAVSQQTPCAQNPDAHSLAFAHEAPRPFGVHAPLSRAAGVASLAGSPPSTFASARSGETGTSADPSGVPTPDDGEQAASTVAIAVRREARFSTGGDVTPSWPADVVRAAVAQRNVTSSIVTVPLQPGMAPVDGMTVHWTFSR
jgi:hypothetical protein